MENSQITLKMDYAGQNPFLNRSGIDFTVIGLEGRIIEVKTHVPHEDRGEIAKNIREGPRFANAYILFPPENFL